MIRLTKHAAEAIGARGIALAWVEGAINAADRVERDPRHRGRMRSYKAISEFGGRVLRVVHQRDGADILVVTAHFDRGAIR